MVTTPSQDFLRSASGEKTVTDVTGRTITIRRPTSLDRLRLFKAVGTSLANNDRYLGLAMLAFSVTAVDGVPVPQPSNEQQIEAVISRLGDNAIAAIAAALDPGDTEGLAVANPGN